MTTQFNTLNICQFNANSVIQKKVQLSQFLHENNVDIMLVSETFLKSRHSFYIPNYDIYRNDRPDTNGGGTAIIIKHTIPHTRINPLRLNSLEHTAIRLNIPQYPLHIYSIYKSPSSTFDPNDLLQINSQPSLLAGDYNCKAQPWSRATNPNGRRLNDFLQNHPDYNIYYPDTPTRYQANGQGDVLDIAITYNVQQPLFPQTITDLDSDHLPVLFTLNVNYEPNPSNNISSENQYDIKKFVNQITQHIQHANPDINTTTDIDQQIELLTNTVQNALKDSLKKQPQLTPDKQYKPLPTDILADIRLKNRIRKLLNRTGDISLKQEINKLQNQIKDKIKNYNATNLQQTIDNLNKDPFTFPTRLTRKRQKVITLTDTNNDKIQDPQDLANLMANNYEQQFKLRTLGSEYYAQLADETQTKLTNSTIQISTDDVITPNETYQHIRTIKKRIAPGIDNIPNFAIKLLPQKAIVLLTKIFNSCTSLSYFPKYWKTSIIVPVHKPLKPQTDPKSYRPISLLTQFSKIYEACLLTRIRSHIEENNIIPPQQFGFRPQHNSSQQLLRLTTQIQNNFIKRRQTVMISLDIRQAFDSVHHKALLLKLHRQKFPMTLLKIINDYLTDRQFKVRVNNHYSDTKQVQAGVPQGSKIGPVLYNLYTADLPQTTNIKDTYIYADDTAFLHSHRNIDILITQTQELTNDLTHYFRLWGLEINPTKSQAILFKHKRYRQPPRTRIHIDNTPITWTKTLQYLGVQLDSKLGFTNHIKMIKSKAMARRSDLRIIFQHSKNIEKTAINIYKAYVRSIITYGIPAWITANPSKIRQLPPIQNNILRRILNIPKPNSNNYLHNIAAIPTLQEHIVKLLKAFWSKLQTHPNPLIQNLLTNIPTTTTTPHNLQRITYIINNNN